MKRRVKKSRRNRSNKYQKGMMGGVNTRPSTPPSRFNMVPIQAEQTPTNQNPSRQEPNASPQVKNKKNHENEYVPVALFQDEDEDDN